MPTSWAQSIQVSQMNWGHFSDNIFNLPARGGAQASLWKAVHVDLAILGEFKVCVYAA